VIAVRSAPSERSRKVLRSRLVSGCVAIVAPPRLFVYLPYHVDRQLLTNNYSQD
jgi:hypothetical protein